MWISKANVWCCVTVCYETTRTGTSGSNEQRPCLTKCQQVPPECLPETPHVPLKLRRKTRPGTRNPKYRLWSDSYSVSHPSRHTLPPPPALLPSPPFPPLRPCPPPITCVTPARRHLTFSSHIPDSRLPALRPRLSSSSLTHLYTPSFSSLGLPSGSPDNTGRRITRGRCLL